MKLFGTIGAGALVVLIPFLRRLITEKAELLAEKVATATAFPV